MQEPDRLDQLCLAREQLNRLHKGRLSTASPAAAPRRSMQGGDPIWVNALWPESKAPSAQVWDCSTEPEWFREGASLWFKSARGGSPITSANWPVILMIPTSFPFSRKEGPEEKNCWLRNDVRRGEGRPQWDGGVCLTIIRHLCLDMKEGREKKNRTHRALVSFLWQPEDYYHTLPFIIKRLVLMGSETLWDGGKTACCILSSQLSQKETEWMNPNKATPISLVITGDSVVNTHVWWTEPVPVKQPAEPGFGYVLLQYQLERLSSQQTCVSPDCQLI